MYRFHSYWFSISLGIVAALLTVFSYQVFVSPHVSDLMNDWAFLHNARMQAIQQAQQMQQQQKQKE